MTGAAPVDDDVDLADLAAVVLLLARRIHAAEAEVEGIVQLGGVETLVMHHIEKNPGVSPTALAHAVGLKPSNASAAVRSLEAHGMVERRRAAGDARCVELWGTDKADRNLERLREGWRAILGPHAPDLDAAQQTVVLLESLDSALANPELRGSRV